MISGELAPATLPPQGLPGLDHSWSRLITTNGDGEPDRTWHVLDNQVANPSLTLLCVHGNPTWSYLWRDMLTNAPDGVRVVAIDHLDMGYSERTGTVRRLEQRVADLSAVTDALELEGPIVTVAHDWGGPISLGWGLEHREDLAGVVLMNTAVHQPDGASAPSLIRMVRTPGVLKSLCQTTPTFIRGTMALSRPRVPKEIRTAFEAPYRSAQRRAAIATFVEDIPLEADHPTFRPLADIAEGIRDLGDVPVLVLWGPSDPVFSDLYLHDLMERLPHASVHRFVGASHLLPEDADVASAVYAWLPQFESAPAVARPVTEREPLWAGIDRRSDDDSVAIVEMGPEGQTRVITFSELSDEISAVAAGMADFGISQGDRVALLVPPGIDLAICVVAAWKAGAVVVLADAGLGVRGMGRALKSADPKYLIGIPKALAAAHGLRWPGIRISAVNASERMERFNRIKTTLPDLKERGASLPTPDPPAPSDIAAIGFTSGATGPAKGVTYRHYQLQAQRDAIVDLYGITDDDRLVAAFGPFALLGTLMGIPSVVPSMSVTSPGDLTALALADATAVIDATLVFASPAALANVSRTADAVPNERLAAFERVRLLLSAGAPVSPALLRAASELMPNASAHTPYGMTEVMPVADIDLAGIDASIAGDGVCVGKPVHGVEVRIDPIDKNGNMSGQLTEVSQIMGEVCVRAEHMRDGYDKLWLTDHKASQPLGWHRTGDIGRIDDEGLLWIEGRTAHSIVTSNGVVTPVGIEHRVARIDGVEMAAVVGVGPVGVQQVVVVVAKTSHSNAAIAQQALARDVRVASGAVDVAAVLVVPSLPVDSRHNSKIDRSKVAAWAEAVLAGGRMSKI